MGKRRSQLLSRDKRADKEFERESDSTDLFSVYVPFPGRLFFPNFFRYWHELRGGRQLLSSIQLALILLDLSKSSTQSLRNAGSRHTQRVTVTLIREASTNRRQLRQAAKVESGERVLFFCRIQVRLPVTPPWVICDRLRPTVGFLYDDLAGKKNGRGERWSRPRYKKRKDGAGEVSRIEREGHARVHTPHLGRLQVSSRRPR